MNKHKHGVLHYNITPLPYAHNFSLLGSQGVYTLRINRADLTLFFAGIVWTADPGFSFLSEPKRRHHPIKRIKLRFGNPVAFQP